MVSPDQVERVSYLLASEGINPTPPNTPSTLSPALVDYNQY